MPETVQMIYLDVFVADLVLSSRVPSLLHRSVAGCFLVLAPLDIDRVMYRIVSY